jgi:general secretion pathway protein F
VSNSISLDDLVALNDEIAGLVRAGIPLEMGLASWSGDVSGSLGRAAARLSSSIERGRSLSDSLADERAQIPRVYSAIVRAGLKSGRLPAALEALATSARNLQEVRSAIGLAAIYPLVLVLVGYFLFLLLVVKVLPAILLVYEAHPPRFWSAVASTGQWAEQTITIPFTQAKIYVALLPPVALLLMVAWWRYRSRRALVLDAGAAGWWLNIVPAAGRALRDARAATWAEILGLLVEQQVPLHEAVVLAAECTGNKRLVRSSRELAASIEQGAMSPTNTRQFRGVPKLLVWITGAGARPQTLTAVSRHVADTYRRRTVREAQWLRDALPMWLVVGVGGLLVGLFGLMLFMPFSQLMETLSALSGHGMRIRP